MQCSTLERNAVPGEVKSKPTKDDRIGASKEGGVTVKRIKVFVSALCAAILRKKNKDSRLPKKLVICAYRE